MLFCMHRILLALLFLGVLLMPGRADEFDRLMDQFSPPALFQEHKPQFAVEEKTFTFKSREGDWNWKFFVIRDGARYVGVVPTTGFHGGTLYVISFNPTQAPLEIPMPSERWHIDNAIGYACRTDQFIPDKNGSKEWNLKDTSEWIVSDDKTTLTLVRKFKGRHAFQKWEHNTQKKEIDVDHTGTFVLSCDPRLGYVLTCTWDTGLTPGAPVGQYTSLMPPGLSNPWPTAGVCQRVAIGMAGKDGYEGWAMNGTAIDMAGGNEVIRDGSFGVYLDTNTGWSCTMTLAGGDAKLSICNVHADLDYLVQWPQDLQPGPDGLRHHKVTIRMLAMPPLLTRHIWDTMRLRFTDAGQTVVFPLQTVESFEDQPLGLDTTRRGFTFNKSSLQPGSMISTTEACTGTRSFRVKGEVWPNIPQVVLKPNRKYRLEAMMKVQPPTAEELAALQAGEMGRIEKERQARAEKIAKLEKQGKEIPENLKREIPDYAPPTGPAEGFISGNLYEWTPHHNEWTTVQATSRAKAGEGWQKVSLEFTAPEWAPFIDIRFVTTQGATGFLDDFFFGEVP